MSYDQIENICCLEKESRMQNRRPLRPHPSPDQRSGLLEEGAGWGSKADSVFAGGAHVYSTC